MRIAVVLLLGVLFSHHLCATALAISYDEAVDGDLPNYPFDAAAFPLDFGINTFSGTQHYVFAGSPGADFFDSFAFTIPAGGRLVSVTADVSLLPEGSGTFASTLTQLQTAPLTGFASGSIPIPSSGLNLFGAALPLNAGTYAMADVGHIGALSSGDFGAASFTYTLTVVPEPSSFVLLALGLLMIGCRRNARSEA